MTCMYVVHMLEKKETRRCNCKINIEYRTKLKFHISRRRDIYDMEVINVRAKKRAKRRDNLTLVSNYHKKFIAH